jgi:hypothetical protein
MFATLTSVMLGFLVLHCLPFGTVEISLSNRKKGSGKPTIGKLNEHFSSLFFFRAGKSGILL